MTEYIIIRIILLRFMFIVQCTPQRTLLTTPHRTLATFSKSYRSLLLSLAFVPVPQFRMLIGYKLISRVISMAYGLTSEPISSFSSRLFPAPNPNVLMVLVV